MDLVQASPQRWPTAGDQTRRFVLRRFPFAIIYREMERVVQVLAIATGTDARVTGKIAGKPSLGDESSHLSQYGSRRLDFELDVAVTIFA
jgi:hypothetical protein